MKTSFFYDFRNGGLANIELKKNSSTELFIIKKISNK